MLKICNLMPQDTGIYTCVAMNEHGSSSSSASIKVQGGDPLFLTSAVCSWLTCSPAPLFGCRYPSSPGEARGSGGEQHGGDGALAPAGFNHPQHHQQLHGGVQAGRCARRPFRIKPFSLYKLNFGWFLFPLAPRLVAMATGGQQQGGVRSDRCSDSRRPLSVQGAGLQHVGDRPAV